MMDHGLRNPTAILFGAVGPDDDIVIYDVYYHTGRLVHENAKAYLELVAEKGIKVEYMVGDPSTQNTDPITGTSIRTEYGENGVWYMLGNNDVHAGILRVKSMFDQNRLHVTANCRNIIKEGRKYKWAKPISNKIQARTNLMEKPVKKDDHALDALRYGIMTLPKTQQELDDDLSDRLKLLIPAVGNSSIFEEATIGKSDGYIDEHLGLIE
jgi:phage terminase large subunit